MSLTVGLSARGGTPHTSHTDRLRLENSASGRRSVVLPSAAVASMASGVESGPLSAHSTEWNRPSVIWGRKRALGGTGSAPSSSEPARSRS